MVFGAAATRGPRHDQLLEPRASRLKQEGISYACGADVPLRGRQRRPRRAPAWAASRPAQGDYFQATRGGGHGDYYHLVLAPKSVQEAADLTYRGLRPRRQVAHARSMVLARRHDRPDDGGRRRSRPTADPAAAHQALGRRRPARGARPHQPRHLACTSCPDELEQANVRARFKRYDADQEARAPLRGD
ncbi:MAG: hypothetical protein M0C28_41620 [Candidatus Moduliflexus flocculans]|nr:hypothetical protein [Candidatus Moduliflexus flocculans]